LCLMTFGYPIHDGVRLLSRHSLFGIKKHQRRAGQRCRRWGSACD
jgi:hypothetical protein